MSRNRGRQRGFTLIEVLVASAIFAMTVGAIFETFAAAMQRGAQARERELHCLIAQSVLSELRIRPAPWPPEQSGRAVSGATWHVTVQPFEAGVNERSSWSAYEVTVAVRSPNAKSADVRLKSIELARVLQ